MNPFSPHPPRPSDIPWMLSVLVTCVLLTVLCWAVIHGDNRYEAGKQAMAGEIRTALLGHNNIHPVVLPELDIELIVWDRGAIVDTRERAEKFAGVKK